MRPDKTDGDKKCANDACQCRVGPPAEFCSDYCSGAEEEAQVEFECSCGHDCCGSERTDA